MIHSKKGVVGLPIKLAVSFLILALMVPPIMSSIDTIRDDAAEGNLKAVAEELGDLIDLVGGKGTRYKMNHKMDLPDGVCLTVGGTEGHLVRASLNGDIVTRVLLDRPVCSDEIALCGTVIIEISSDQNGVNVREL